MKLVITIIIVGLTLFNFANAQERTRTSSKGDNTKFTTSSVIKKKILNTDAKEMNLRNQIKSITERTYKGVERNGEIIKSDTSSSAQAWEFDLKGNIIKAISYEEDGSLSSFIEYKYDKPGMKIEMKFSSGNRETYEYNEDDYRISTSNYDSKGNITEKIVYKYYFNYRANEYTLITDTVYVPDYNTKKLIGSYIGSYDYNYVLDSDTNIISEKSFGLETIKTYEYNSQKQKVFLVFQGKNDSVYDTLFTERYEYSGNGDITKIIPTGDASAWDFQYTYDSKGNWIKRTSKQIDTANETIAYIIKERIIEYH